MGNVLTCSKGRIRAVSAINVLFATITLLNLSCSTEYRWANGKKSSSGSTVFSSSSTALFRASLNRVAPQGDVPVNQVVQWQVSTVLNPTISLSDNVAQFQIVSTANSNISVTFSVNGAGNFSKQYIFPSQGFVEKATIQAQDFSGNPVGAPLTVSSDSFNILNPTTTGSGGTTTGGTTGVVIPAPSTFACSTTASNNTPTISVNASGTPTGSSTAVTYVSVCSGPATLMSVNADGATFTRPTTDANGGITVQGTFTTTGYHNVQFMLFPKTGSGSANTSVTTFVQAIAAPPPPAPLACTLTGNSVLSINVNSAGTPIARSLQGNYSIGANKAFSLGSISNDGGFAANGGQAGQNNTFSFSGTYAAPGTFYLKTTITSGGESATCQVTTVVSPNVVANPDPTPPTPPALVCSANGTAQVSIAVDQNGAPIARSSEAHYNIYTSRAAGPSNLSAEGGFAAFYGAAGAGNSFLVKGNYAIPGTFNFWLTMSDGSSQATCPVTTSVVPYGVSKSAIWRSFKPGFTDHLLSKDRNEGPNAGYVRESSEFATYDSATNVCNVPLYGCLLRRHHFVSNSANCEGQTTERFLGWVCAGQAPGTRKLYRIRSKDWIDHLTTADWSQVVYAVSQLHYIYEGPQGFAPLP